MAERYFISTEIESSQHTLDGDQAHHAINVMRIKPDQVIVLFDGRGKEYDATVVDVRKKALDVEVNQVRDVNRMLSRDITIGVALPKGDRQKVLIEKLVELGVRRLVPIETTRGVAVANAKSRDRMLRYVVEASKQCRRAWLMEIGEKASLKEIARQDFGTTLRLVADPYCSTPIASVAAHNEPVFAIVGPEGGLDEVEMEILMKEGWRSVSLGATILRIETAAIAIAAVLGIGTLGNS